MILNDGRCSESPWGRCILWASVALSESPCKRAQSFSHVGNVGSTPAGITTEIKHFSYYANPLYL